MQTCIQLKLLMHVTQQDKYQWQHQLMISEKAPSLGVRGGLEPTQGWTTLFTLFTFILLTIYSCWLHENSDILITLSKNQRTLLGTGSDIEARLRSSVDV